VIRNLLLAAILLTGCTSITSPDPARPTINKFASDSATIAVGSGTFLHWIVSDGAVRIDPSVGDGLAATGNYFVNPIVTTTYTLTARNNFGQAVASVTVVVK
jgi:hypothetical protein